MSRGLLKRAFYRYQFRRPGQLLLAVLGVALGVAVTLSIDLAIESSRASFRASTEAVAGRATHTVTGGAAGLADSVFAPIRRVVGPQAAAPVVEAYVRSTQLSDRPLRLLGVDPLSEMAFRAFAGGDGQGSAGLLGGNEVVISAELASDADVVVGDTLALETPTGPVLLVVSRVFDPAGDLQREGARDLLLVDIASAQELLGVQGLSRIDLILPQGAAGDTRLREVTAAIPRDALIRTTGARAVTLADMTRAFDLNLTALSLLALLFGMFLIYNTTTFAVVQRRPLIGSLRALGVTRGQVWRVMLAEVGLIALVGSVLGLGLGAVLGRGVVGLVTQTMNDLYAPVNTHGLVVAPMLLVKASALGVLSTLAAALPPIREAVLAPPRIASLRSELERQARAFMQRGGVAGGVLLGVGLAVIALSGRTLLLSFTGLFLVVLGAALLSPLGAMALIAVLRPLLARTLGPLGRLAAGGVTGALSRTGPAIAALVVAVSVSVGLGVMISSFRGTVIDWLDQTLQADVYVSPPGGLASRAQGALEPEFVAQVRALDGMDGLSVYRGVEFESGYGRTRLVALDLAPRGERAFRFDGVDGEIALRAFRERGAVIVSEPFAYRHALSRGDVVSLPTPDGDRDFSVAGVFYEYGSEAGTIMMAQDTYRRIWADSSVTSLGVFGAPGVPAEVLAERVRGLAGADRVVVRSNRTLREASLVVFDRTFAVTAVLRLLALGVAFIGVLGALMALELERAREHAVLRAQGVTPMGLWGLVTAETGLIGLVSGVLAVPTGLLLAEIMIDVINKRSFGWTLNTYIPPSVLAQAVLLAVCGALLAGIVPAWRMGRTSPADALRNE